MKLSNFDYNLPRALIAQEPMKPRDHSRLLLLDKKTGKIEHKNFYDLPDYLEKGDVLVLNNSKVFPARLIGQRKGSGGRVEIFLLRRHETHPPSGKPEGPLSRGDLREVWQCLVGGHRRKEGLIIEFNGRDEATSRLTAEVIGNNRDGTFDVAFNRQGKDLMNIVNRIGQTPLPPYIKRSGRDALQCVSTDDKNTYQTVYADDKKIGSVAAPTAGFHFTPGLIDKLKKKGVQFEYVTLHVGLGTFAPVKADDITKHQMHAEWVEINKETVERLNNAVKKKKRIIAVGTTSVRSLEAFQKEIGNWKLSARGGSALRGEIGNLSGWVNIFIYPGYEFRIVDAMITNFHLPKSTLLMLVSAFAGKENIFNAYDEAIRKKYRFYSYGDAMLIR